MFHHKLLVTIYLAGLTQLSDAQPIRQAGECTIKAASDAVMIVVCPARSSDDVWRTAGEAACESRLACNAWVWHDSGQAPDVAPKTDADLPKSSSANAVAIWINDSKSLVKLKKAGAAK